MLLINPIGTLGPQGGSFLSPKDEALAPLKQNPQLVQKGQIWRFFTPLFTNVTLQSFFFNVIIMMILAPRVEKLQGWASLLGIMMIGGLGGTLFSSISASTNALNRTCPMALSWAVIGSQAGCLMINFGWLQSMGGMTACIMWLNTMLFSILMVISQLVGP